ncbi:hypothetical protein BHE74_00053164 [Ensete ventricosum]|nr:hypothetical protein GW17_00041206 [Ensete ventricosum]RWW41353.1 hypothetical protein BHE74_00053164 [Ensete ventricosum]RZS08232.1 hypothetical protein BHM03_00039177 [Ensete ventricosum]
MHICLQVFSSWMHFCAVRVFAESILRYGLPPSFLVLNQFSLQPFLFIACVSAPIGNLKMTLAWLASVVKLRFIRTSPSLLILCD